VDEAAYHILPRGLPARDLPVVEVRVAPSYGEGALRGAVHGGVPLLGIGARFG
jgi:hypothetical protein